MQNKSDQEKKRKDTIVGKNIIKIGEKIKLPKNR